MRKTQYIIFNNSLNDGSKKNHLINHMLDLEFATHFHNFCPLPNLNTYNHYFYPL
jgi:hypothetical protein